ncbi:MAG: hypothetical protein COX89_01910 [Candidatus Nealsonbacteria bacterium CG_4_10_14_0_2_um_filter_37_10]|uniref:Uncharacterized protein n=1 Tax=Candidatus Nealsonbacteria bacterium CG_4_10_14_0_2_um_filter_37_10 TaxID=1974679 RepID=A0A2M7UZI7_9BACT|nr:MAG: hypothetical protein COX89_01910 [Candidatus Nealsonbacteria bacterium CG_4_10_14_0_2_um_filter_37_10]
MSLLNFLDFQEIDPSYEDISENHQQDDIILDEQINEESLDNYWNKVIEDIHQDAEWFTFADE